MQLIALRPIRMHGRTHAPGELLTLADEQGNQLLALGTAILPGQYETKIITPAPAAPVVAAATFRHGDHADDAKPEPVVDAGNRVLPGTDAPDEAPDDRLRGRKPPRRSRRR